jgi:AcrR family transcriptional regulator
MTTAPPTTPTTLRELAARYTAVQRRTITAALELFGVHGLGGTSLQMIADALGVTKAAIYHQFRTRDAIALAAIEVHLQPFEAALEAAEWAGPSIDTREELLAAVIDVAVDNRRATRTLQSDPVLFRMLGEYPPSIRMWTRLFRMLLGDEADDRVVIRASALSGILGTAAYPYVIGLDDDAVRDELMRIARGLIFPPR